MPATSAVESATPVDLDLVHPTHLFGETVRPLEDDKPQDECGVFGIWSPDQAAAVLAYFALFNLQHRGQDSAGIATSHQGEITTHKNVGLVSQVFEQQDLARLPGELAIGHTRYTTSQAHTLRLVQPQLEGDAAAGEDQLAFAFNGNISNSAAMEQFLQEQGIETADKNDTLLMSALLWHFLQETDDMVAAIEKCWPFWIGAFSLVILWKEQLFGVRGPYGVRPLVLGEMMGGYAVASESAAFNSVGTLLRAVQPGEVVIIEKGKPVSSHMIEVTPEMLDAFELVYFARPDSEFFGKSIYEMRRDFGKILWREHQVQGDLVVAVPDSASPAAEGYAEASGIPLRQCLIKSRYVHRTFIQPTQEQRELAQSYKLHLIDSQVKGKRVILIDDSLVRGTTLKAIVQRFIDAGALEVHVMIASPPVKYPNFYGIATPEQDTLLAAQMNIAEIAAYIGATSVQYLSVAGMVEGIGVSQEQLMTSDFTGEYPIDIGTHAAGIKNIA